MNEIYKDLGKRTASACALGIAVLAVTWWHAISFDVLLLVASVLLWNEWRALTRKQPQIFMLFGLVYIAAGCISLGAIRHYYGWEMVFALFALVWMGDIAAYLIGSRYGKHKIVPEISPGKSWEGLAASLVVSMIVSGGLLWMRYQYQPLSDALKIGAAFALLGFLGDAFESYLKRKAGVKDSGELIPGHGGLFDRVDALLPCSIYAAAILFL